LTLYYCNECKSELNVISSFLQWQNIKVETCNSPKTLEFTGGKFQPVLVENNKVLGVGFFGILKYLESRSLLK
jgi:hypothetical protein